MLRQRVVVAAVLLPIGLGVIYLGGIVYLAVITALLAIAAWEYSRLFQAGGFRPATLLLIGGVIALTVGRYTHLQNNLSFASDSVILGAFILLSMAYHAWAYEQGSPYAGTDFAITVGGMMYVGFLGSYLILIRNLPDGLWWLLTTLPAVWLADSGAYFVGRKIGRTQFSRRLSPKKSWEGYLSGVVIGTLGTALLALGWRALAGYDIQVTALNAGILGFILAVVTPVGDLGESMLKRQVGIKDSSHLFPGHGGALDRIDTWLWAGLIGYHLIAWFF